MLLYATYATYHIWCKICRAFDIEYIYIYVVQNLLYVFHAVCNLLYLVYYRKQLQVYSFSVYNIRTLYTIETMQ